MLEIIFEDDAYDSVYLDDEFIGCIYSPTTGPADWLFEDRFLNVPFGCPTRDDVIDRLITVFL